MDPELVIVIPARGGSKRVPNKNIVPLLGRPLLAYTLDAALASAVGQRVVVSTDSSAIAAVGRQQGAEVIMRPADLAADTASTEGVLLHALDALAAQGWLPKTVLTLPPTAPLRTAATVRRFVDAFHEHGAAFDAMISLSEERGDFWTQGAHGYQRLFPNASRRSQERTPLFLENSALYITRAAALQATGSILGRTVTGFLIDAIEAVDINEPRDLLWAEFLLQHRDLAAAQLRGAVA